MATPARSPCISSLTHPDRSDPRTTPTGTSDRGVIARTPKTLRYGLANQYPPTCGPGWLLDFLSVRWRPSV